MTEAEVQLAPEDERKLFVGGLPQEAKDTDIKEYFETFGEIESVNLKTDPNTGRSRGFAFIVFKEPSSLGAASADESHVIKVLVYLVLKFGGLGSLSSSKRRIFI